MSLTNSPFWMAQTAAGFYGYEIDGSLRFDNTGYLTRTNGTPTDEDVWTFSAWVKRSGTASTTSGDTMLGAGQYPGNNNSIRFSNDEGQDELIIFNGGSGQNKGYKRSRNLYRDNSAWYHVCVSRSGGTIAMEVNGVACDIYTQVGFDASVNSQNSSGYTHYVGASERALTPYSGYMAEVNFIDGQALAASYFGETKSGIWIPKEYSGSYGNNGYQLKFNGNANDSSGNGNNFASTNISSHDYVLDSPTNNFSTNNGRMRANITQSEGNLKMVGVGGNFDNMGSTFTFDVEDADGWYWEYRSISNNSDTIVGISTLQNVEFNQSDATNPFANTTACVGYMGSGQKKVAGTNSSYGNSWTAGDIIGIAVKSGAVYFYKNGVIQNSGTAAATGLTGNYVAAYAINGTYSGTANYGQDSTFVGTTTAGGNSDAGGYGDFKYSVPSGYKALCSANMTEPTFSPADDTISEDYFNTVLYTGNGSSQSITGVGFKPDLVWIKDRSDGGNDHKLYDFVRGQGKELEPSSSDAEYNWGAAPNAGLYSFNSDGFSVGSNPSHNASSHNYVAWTWLGDNTTGTSNTDGSITSTVNANTDAGFSVVTWTGTSGSDTIGHGLGAAPAMIITKPRSADNWIVYHEDMGATKQVYLDLENAQETNSNIYSVVPTSSVFTIGSWSGTRNLVSYCFAEKEGYSKIGSYTGNGSSDGPFVYTDFRPAFLLIKRIGSSGPWLLWDNKRTGYNGDNDALRPNSTAAEYNGTTYKWMDLVSNGFKIIDNSVDFNNNGETFIYMAFAEQPFKYANAR